MNYKDRGYELLSACELAEAVKGLFGYSDDEVSACSGVMGVPITFLDKYNPEQFEIIDISPHFFSMVEQGLQKLKQLTLKSKGWKKDPYARILIRRKQNEN